jgi:hypothetical protein
MGKFFTDDGADAIYVARIKPLDGSNSPLINKNLFVQEVFCPPGCVPWQIPTHPLL